MKNDPDYAGSIHKRDKIDCELLRISKTDIFIKHNGYGNGLNYQRGSDWNYKKMCYWFRDAGTMTEGKPTLSYFKNE